MGSLDVRGYIECKPDRVHGNFDWLDFWSFIDCFTLPCHTSNHNSIMLRFSENLLHVFEHADLKVFVAAKWNSYEFLGSKMYNFIAKLKVLKVDLQEGNKMVLGNVHKRAENWQIKK